MALIHLAKGIWHTIPKGIRNTPQVMKFGNTIKNKLSRSADDTLQINSAAETLKKEATASVGSDQPVDFLGDKPTRQKNLPKKITSLEELDVMLKRLDALAAISDDELRKGFAEFYMDFPIKLPKDPESNEYRQSQMELYKWLHGKEYSIQNEVNEYDIDSIVSRPFPFYTESPQIVGNQLIAIGHLIKSLDLKPKGKVLEFGPGWGNTTVFLARMGYEVTAVDINRNFLEVIDRRAKAKTLSVKTINGDFAEIEKQKEQFDAIVFFECFHHCADHQRLIANFDKVLAPGGKVLFAAEPITNAFPIPWGLRLDGESLWAIRKNGWLELGFQESYFRNLMSKHGWKINKQVCSDTPWGEVFIASRNTS